MGPAKSIEICAWDESKPFSKRFGALEPLGPSKDQSKSVWRSSKFSKFLWLSISIPRLFGHVPKIFEDLLFGAFKLFSGIRGGKSTSEESIFELHQVLHISRY